MPFIKVKTSCPITEKQEAADTRQESLLGNHTRFFTLLKKYAL